VATRFPDGDAYCVVRPSTLVSQPIGKGTGNRCRAGLVLLARCRGNLAEDPSVRSLAIDLCTGSGRDGFTIPTIGKQGRAMDKVSSIIDVSIAIAGIIST